MRSYGLVLILLLLGTGCTQKTTVPFDTLVYEEERQAHHLIVFLRGRGGSPIDFAEQGFVATIRQAGLSYDMVVPDAHFGYYRNRSLVKRLKEDIIAPAQARGYEQIWLVGVSMGGLGALFYTKEYPADISGVLLIAPFVGYDAFVEKIEAAGGIRHWQAGIYDDNDWQCLLWDWLQGYKDKPDLPPLYLAYGQDDRYGLGHDLLTEIISPDHLFTISGGHTYPVFTSLWQQFVQHGDLSRVP